MRTILSYFDYNAQCVSRTLGTAVYGINVERRVKALPAAYVRAVPVALHIVCLCAGCGAGVVWATALPPSHWTPCHYRVPACSRSMRKSCPCKSAARAIYSLQDGGPTIGRDHKRPTVFHEPRMRSRVSRSLRLEIQAALEYMRPACPRTASHSRHVL